MNGDFEINLDKTSIRIESISECFPSLFNNQEEMKNIQIPFFINARRHKKKRINKKLIKRYGKNPILTFKKVKAKQITVTADDCYNYLKQQQKHNEQIYTSI